MTRCSHLVVSARSGLAGLWLAAALTIAGPAQAAESAASITNVLFQPVSLGTGAQEGPGYQFVLPATTVSAYLFLPTARPHWIRCTTRERCRSR